MNENTFMIHDGNTIFADKIHLVCMHVNYSTIFVKLPLILNNIVPNYCHNKNRNNYYNFQSFISHF